MVKIRIRPHPEIFKEFNVVGLPFWKKTGTTHGHHGYKKYMIMLEPKKELLSPNEQLSYEPVAEIIADSEEVPASLKGDKRLIIEEVKEHDEGTSPKTRKQSKGGDIIGTKH